MIILLAGSAGQLGQELQPQIGRLGRVIPVDRAVGPDDRDTVIQELGELGQVEVLLNRTRPDMVVNAAAYTAVDLAEDEPDAAYRINGDLPGCLARWCARNERVLLHYSTDYVFSGQADRPYTEDDPTGPLGVYGASKLAGEQAISASECRHVILRTSWVYSGHGNNFVLTMLRLAQERPSLSVVSDQVGCPTWARNLARVTRKVLQRLSADEGMHGTFHYCDRDAVSWYGFARMIFANAARMGLLERMPEMTPVPTSGFPRKAARPLYSVLDVSRIQGSFGIQPAGLEDSLQACLEEMEADD